MSASARKAAHFVALDFLKSKGSATPAEIDAYVGAGAYSSKYICYLKLEGYEIETVKNGRKVAEYKFISDGDSATRNYKWVSPKLRGKPAKPAKVSVPKASKPVKVAKAKAAPVAVKPRKVDVVERQFGSSGEVSSYGIDADFDSMDGIDIKSIII